MGLEPIQGGDGMLAHVERFLRALLLWLICQLHGNELGLRHVFTHCDGGHGTSGPDSFKGPLGQALMKVVQFQPVATSLADIDEEVQKCLSRGTSCFSISTLKLSPQEPKQKS